MQTNEILIYSAGKTWAAAGFKKMRDIHGYNITARWIDVQDVLMHPEDEFPEHILNDEEYKREIWDEGCKVDCGACDMGILFGAEHDKNMHSGSLVELGHITASEMYTGIRKPVYIIGDCESFRPVGNSDRAWKAQEIVHHAPHITDMLQGFVWATDHYRNNYAEDWLKSRQNVFHAVLRAKNAA